MSFAEFDTTLRSTSLTKIAEREENGRNGKVRVKVYEVDRCFKDLKKHPQVEIFQGTWLFQVTIRGFVDVTMISRIFLYNYIQAKKSNMKHRSHRENKDKIGDKYLDFKYDSPAR